MAKKNGDVLARLTVPVELGIKELSKSFQVASKHLASFSNHFSRDLSRTTVGISRDFSRLGSNVARSLSSSFSAGSRSANAFSRDSRMAFTSVLNNATKVSGQMAKTMQSAFRGGGRAGGLSGGIFTGIFQGVGQSLYASLANSMVAPMRLLGQSIADAVDAEAVNRKFESVFRGINQTSKAWAAEFGRDMGRSVTDVQAMMARFQDTLVPVGFSRSRASSMTKVLTRLSGDLAISEGISELEAADRIVSGMVGNHEALRRFGVLITETSLNARLLAMGIKNGSQEATGQQKILARLNLLLEGTRDAQGMAATATGSFGKEWRGLQSTLTDLSATMGQVLTPSLAKISSFASRGVSDIKAAMGDTTRLGDMLGDSLGGLLDKLTPLRDDFVEFFETIGENGKQAIEGWTAAMDGFVKSRKSLSAIQLREKAEDMAVKAGNSATEFGALAAGSFVAGGRTQRDDWIRELLGDLAGLSTIGGRTAAKNARMADLSGESRMGPYAGMTAAARGRLGSMGYRLSRDGNVTNRFTGEAVDSITPYGALSGAFQSMMTPLARNTGRYLQRSGVTDASSAASVFGDMFGSFLGKNAGSAVGMRPMTRDEAASRKRMNGWLESLGLDLSTPGSKKASDEYSLPGSGSSRMMIDMWGNAFKGFGQTISRLIPRDDTGSLKGFGKAVLSQALDPENLMPKMKSVQFAGLTDIQKQIQMQLGNDSESKKRELMVKALEETKKTAAEQLDEMKKAPEAIGKAISKAMTSLTAVLG